MRKHIVMLTPLIMLWGRWRCSRNSLIIGLLPAAGTRASSTSITMSMRSIVSAAFLRAEVM